MSNPSSVRAFLLRAFRQELQDFASSSSTFRVVRTVPPSASPPAPPPRTLYVLDASFNPPTLAHLHIALDVLLHDQDNFTAKRLLLLLATQNADKAPKPASFEQRLGMMTAFTEEIYQALETSPSMPNFFPEQPLAIDIAITKHPFFVDKAAAIDASPFYSSPSSSSSSLSYSNQMSNSMHQVHLLGFDSLTRLLDPKYYPPEHTLAPLSSLFSQHFLRVMYRAGSGDSYGSRIEQERYVARLANGERESEGGQRAWAEKIQLAEGLREGVSSTKARQVIEGGDEEALKTLVGESVRRWIIQEGLYRDEGEG